MNHHTSKMMLKWQEPLCGLQIPASDAESDHLFHCFFDPAEKDDSGRQFRKQETPSHMNKT